MRRRGKFWACVVAAALASCVGDSTPDADGGADATSDATIDVATDAMTDAGSEAAPPTCSVSAAFGAPTLVASVNLTGNDAYLRLTTDNLLGVVESQADGSTVYQASRAAPGDPFSNVTALATVGAQPDVPALSGDGLTLVFDSVRAPDAGGLGGYDLFVATRTLKTSTFTLQGAIQNIDTQAYDEESPFLRADGAELYFVSLQSGTKALYRSANSGSGFGTPTAVTEINVGNIFEAAVTPDDLVMYFSTDRTDGGSKGGFDIWVATRAKTSDPFSNFTIVPELNTSANDHIDFVTADRCTVYIHRASDIDGGGTLRQVWSATKQP